MSSAANPSLSVVIITLNEAQHIRECLQSVAWADEIIVMDSGSSDATQAICEEFKVKWYVNREWPGFGPQKNLALAKATGDWVLSLDADERVTPSLKASILATLQNPQANGYWVPRLAYFLDQPMRHGGWWPDYVMRLFKRDCAQFAEVLVHETVDIQGATARLSEPLIHYSYVSLEQLLRKIDQYSSAGAQEAFKRGKRGGLLIALLRGGWAFLRAYCLRAGFLDGSAGLIAALSKGHETYYRYLKLGRLYRS